MENPIKIHSIELTKGLMEGSETLVTKEIVIKQIDSKGEIKDLYKASLSKHKNNYNMRLFDKRLQKKPGIPITYIRTLTEEHIDGFITELNNRFKHGRVLNSDTLWTVHNAVSKKLSYKAVKYLLNFEKKASRFLDKKPLAIQTANPLNINSIVDCGEYIIESWPEVCWSERHHYTYTTFNLEIAEWIEKVVKYL